MMGRADGLTIRGLVIAGLVATRGATGVRAIGLAAGAVWVVTTLGERFCVVALAICPEALWIVGRMAAIEQKIKNRFCFISLSAN